MEKKRAEKGDWYWFIFRTKGGGFVVNCKIEEGSSDDNARFNIGNYFIVKEEALSMARKLRAILAGADVIQMPSEEEINKEISSSAHKMDIDDNETPNSGLYWIGWRNAVEWFKSKIIK